jgi:hypothetical protein
MLLQFAPGNEDQVGGAGREASAYWFAIHSGSVPVLAQDWVECGAEGDLAKVRQLATRIAGVVLPLVTEAPAMVRQRSQYRHLGARQKSRRLIAAKIHLNTNETQVKEKLTRLSILTSLLLFSSVARSVATLARSSCILRTVKRAAFASSRAASNSSSTVSSSGTSSVFASMRSC